MRLFTRTLPQFSAHSIPAQPALVMLALFLAMAGLLISFAPQAKAQITTEQPSYTQLFPPQEFAYGVVLQDARYVVAKGDTLYGISRRFNIPVTSLDAAINGAELFAGQIFSLPFEGAMRPKVAITIPAKQNSGTIKTTSAQSSSQSGANYIVQAGDTLWSLSRKFGLSVSNIAAANGLSTEAQLNKGQRLTIPQAGTAKPAATSASAEQISTKQSQANKQSTNNLVVISKENGNLPSLVINTPKKETAPAASPKSDDQSNKAVKAKTQNEAKTETKTESKAAAASKVKENKNEGRPGMLWPLRGNLLMDFGLKANGIKSNGIVIAATEGAPVVAADDGEVVYAGDKIQGYGNMILLRHKNSISTVYANNQTLLVKVGDKVARGQKIALAGQTGDAKRAQLTFEVRLKEEPVNPLDHLGK